MKDTLKAADLRDVGGPAAAASVAASPAGKDPSVPPTRTLPGSPSSAAGEGLAADNDLC